MAATAIANTVAGDSFTKLGSFFLGLVIVQRLMMGVMMRARLKVRLQSV
jgi:hypothetical protein